MLVADRGLNNVNLFHEDQALRDQAAQFGKEACHLLRRIHDEDHHREIT